jgi:hypothetical protein
VTAVGIYNPNSKYNRAQRSNEARLPVRRTVTLDDLEDLAAWMSGKYQVALYRRNEVQIRAIEENLRAIVEWANDLKAVQS